MKRATKSGSYQNKLLVDNESCTMTFIDHQLGQGLINKRIIFFLPRYRLLKLLRTKCRRVMQIFLLYCLYAAFIHIFICISLCTSRRGHIARVMRLRDLVESLSLFRLILIWSLCRFHYANLWMMRYRYQMLSVR